MEKRCLRCEFDICNKRLIDFCFVRKIDGKYFCDDVCADREQEQREARKEKFLWQ